LTSKKALDNVRYRVQSKTVFFSLSRRLYGAVGSTSQRRNIYVRKKSNMSSLLSIDRKSFEPAYLQLVKILRLQVAEGIFRPGDRLPSEAELCRTHQVSPMTVRRAINMLVDQDVVNTEQGRGTFVKQPELGTATFHLRELQSLFSDPSGAKVDLLGVRIATADKSIAEKLGLSVGDKTIYIRRLISINSEPAYYHREYMVYDPTRPIVESEMEFTSLEGLFDGSGSSIFKLSELTIEATLMDEEEAHILNMPIPSAAMSLTHIFYDYRDQPVSWGWFICRSDQMRFKTKVGISEGV